MARSSRPNVYKNFGPARRQYTRVVPKGAPEGTRPEWDIIQDAREMARPILEAQEEERRVRSTVEDTVAHLRAKGIRILTPTTNITSMEDYRRKKVIAICSKRHKWESTLDTLRYSRSQYNGCHKCGNNAKGNPRADARLRVKMQHDEQGYDIIDFKSLAEPYTVLGRKNRHRHTLRSSNADRWKIGGKSKAVHCVINSQGYAFVWVGAEPRIKHPFIMNLILSCKTNRYFGDNQTRQTTGLMGLKTAIAELIDDGAKVVNISHNPSFIERGEYTWGELPTSAALAAYFDGAPDPYGT